MTSRRTFVLALSAALLAPAAAQARVRGVVRRVGFLALGNRPSSWSGTLCLRLQRAELGG